MNWGGVYIWQVIFGNIDCSQRENVPSSLGCCCCALLAKLFTIKSGGGGVLGWEGERGYGKENKGTGRHKGYKYEVNSQPTMGLILIGLWCRFRG